MGFIYKIENIINGKFYIGSSVHYLNRKKTHLSKLKHNKHDNSHLQQSYNKHGVDAFVFSILEENITTDQLEARELFYLQTMQPQYNLSIDCVRPCTGRKLSDEHRRKISIAHGGNGILKEKRTYPAGITFSEKMSIINKEHYESLSDEEKASKNAHKVGKVFSHTTKKKLKDKKLGKTYSNAHRKSISDGLKNYFKNKKIN